jgi:hypothetical protein
MHKLPISLAASTLTLALVLGVVVVMCTPSYAPMQPSFNRYLMEFEPIHGRYISTLFIANNTIWGNTELPWFSAGIDPDQGMTVE